MGEFPLSLLLYLFEKGPFLPRGGWPISFRKQRLFLPPLGMRVPQATVWSLPPQVTLAWSFPESPGGLGGGGQSKKKYRNIGKKSGVFSCLLCHKIKVSTCIFFKNTLDLRRKV